MSKQALDILKKAGAKVDYTCNHASIPRNLVQEALDMAPKTITYAARNPKYDFVLNKQEPHFCADGSAPFIIDSETGERRYSTSDDIVRCATIADYLEKIAKELAGEKAVVVQEIDTEIGQMLIVADSIPMFGWELVIFRQISEIYKPTSILESNLALITFIILIFLFIISIFFSQLIVSPIKKLHSGMEIIRKGNLDYRVDIRTNDEIEDLGTAFNRMTEELERYHSASEESKAILQIKVKARTKELEELAEGLDNKVEDRTKPLEERLSELEKFHKLTVGREIKMIKLKKEIQKLKNREIK